MISQDIVYNDYLKEKKWITRVTIYRRIVSYTFLILFLYFLFSVSYTASPAIVILNYLALLTSFSGIILFKMYEIPHCVLEILNKGDHAEFFRLDEMRREEILKNLCDAINLKPRDSLFKNYNSAQTIETFQLASRAPWKKIGKVYLFIYFSTVIFFCSYLTYIYLETGFMPN
ncbi:MAG: hypothetical protein SH817_14955 [Leptospira sp.]|nr:hypothetical protein [Leptospira sp.]